MKVLAVNGSPHSEGNTAGLAQQTLTTLQSHGIETELFQLGGKLVRGCMGCGHCRKYQTARCVINDDCINECIAKMIEADAILLASPTYFANLTTELKALIDRAGYVARGNNGLFRRKVGAALVVMRRAGALNVFNAINDFFLINDMIVPGSSYWNVGTGDIASDTEGLKTATNLANNIAWLLPKLVDSKSSSQI